MDINKAFQQIFGTDKNLISNDKPRIQHMLDLEAKRQGVRHEREAKPANKIR